MPLMRAALRCTGWPLAVLFGTLTGCNTGLIPAAALNESAADPFSAVVSGDVAEGFRDHVSTVSAATGESASPAGLSDDERAEIEQLQMQLDNGEFTAEQFGTQVDAVLGDHAPQAAFGGLGFFGSPFGDRVRQHVGDKLALTDEQSTAARELFQATHQQIRVLRLTALANIRLQLTEEQRTKLDQLRDERFASIREEGGFPPGALRGRGLLPRLGLGRDGIRERVGGFFDRLAAELGVTDEQRTAIQAIREQLRADVQGAHQAARESFRALLTAEQLALLEQIETRIEEHLNERAGGSSPGEDR